MKLFFLVQSAALLLCGRVEAKEQQQQQESATYPLRGIANWGLAFDDPRIGMTVGPDGDTETPFEELDTMSQMMRTNEQRANAVIRFGKSKEETDGAVDRAHAEVLLRRQRKRYTLNGSVSRAAAEALADQVVYLHVELVGNFGEAPEGLLNCSEINPRKPTGDARVSVDLGNIPATMSLRNLHTDVLSPALGWKRRYHAYMFTDPVDGSQFGIGGKEHPAQMNSRGMGPVDLMHMDHRGYEVIDDRTVTLADLIGGAVNMSAPRYDPELGVALQKFSHANPMKPAGFFYLSDLGAAWNYSVTVTDVGSDFSQVFGHQGVANFVDSLGVMCVSARCPVASSNSKKWLCPPEDGDPGGATAHSSVDDWCGQIADERETRRFKRGAFRVAFGRDTEDGTALERQIQARLDDAATRLPSEIDDDAHVGSSSFGFGGRDHGFNREL